MKAPKLAVLMACVAAPALAQVSGDDMNKSNNPLTPAPAASVQDFYAPKLYGSGGYTNDFLLRGTLPVLPGETIKLPQVFRLSVPVSTRPDPSGGNSTGVGDINIFDIFLLGKFAGTEIGVGPLLTMPTASNRHLGTGKWQGGAAVVAMHPDKWGMCGLSCGAAEIHLDPNIKEQQARIGPRCPAPCATRRWTPRPSMPCAISSQPSRALRYASR